MVQKNASIEPSVVSNLFYYRSEYDREVLDMISFLIKAGSDPNHKNSDGYTLLMYCSLKGYYKHVKSLIRHGCDMNGSCLIKIYSIQKEALTPKYCQKRKKPLEKYTFQSSANKPILGYRLETAFSIATKMGHTRIVDLLREAGAR